MIELSKLTAGGLRLEGAVERVPLEGSEFLRGLSWTVFIQRSNGDVFFDIQAEALFETSCCRCLEPLDTKMKIRSQFLGSADPALVERGSHTLGTQDLDVVYLPEELLDEEALVREQFVLQRPMQQLCKDDCQGLCSLCGKNWNKGRCQCRPEYSKAPGALARALAEAKLDVRP